MAALADALASARAGRGRVLLLVGEPGIGKTRVVEEFAVRTREAGAEVLSGRCYEGGGAPAFYPWTQVVRAYVAARDATTLEAELGLGAVDVAAVVPELHQWLPGIGAPPQVSEAQARFRFFEALTRGFARAATQRPLAIVLEDLHAADASSLLLLQFLAREVRSARLVVVGTLRDVPITPGDSLAETLGELVREQVGDRLDLVGLGADDVAELMARMAGEQAPAALAAEVHARTEGNPLYVTEVVRAMLANGGFGARDGLKMPPTVRVAITRHLGVLSPPARETLTMAALFGREFRADVVARAGGDSIDGMLTHVDEAVTARIVVRPGEPGRYRFAHALFGETLVEALAERRRMELHRHAARALADDPRAEQVVQEIAHHWHAAGPGGGPAEAVAWARRAAERAAGMLAYEDAATWWARALEALGWLGGDDPAARAELLLGLGEAQKRAGADADAKATFEQAAAVGRALRSPEIVTRAALGYAPFVPYAQGIDPTLVTLLEEAIAAWDGTDSSLHARARARLGVGLLFGDDAQRMALLTEGLEMARRTGDPATLRYALVALFTGYWRRDDFEGRLDLATELVRLADSARDLEALATGRLWRAVHLVECGDVAAADAEIVALSRLAEDLRQPAWRWYARNLEVMRCLLDGRFADAETAIERAYDAGRAALPYVAECYRIGALMILRILQGRPGYVAEFRTMLEMHPDRAAMSPIAWAECEMGRAEEGRKVFESVAQDDFAAIRREIPQSVAAIHLGQACAALEDRERAQVLYEILEPHARHWAVWAEAAPLGPVALTLGLLARTMGRFDQAAEHFEHAIAESRRVGARPFLARSLYEYAVLLRRLDHPGDAHQAAAMLTEARAIAAAIGMAGLERKIAAMGEVEGARLTAPSGVDAVSSEPAPNVFRREGEYWTIAYGGTAIRLRDTKGLGYLAWLLAHPGREIHVAALAVPDAGDRPPERDLGAVLDPRATAEYKRRVADLREELEEATAAADLGRAARAREEIEAITRELSAAYGLGGRARRAGDRAERQRKAVTNQIRRTVERIRQDHPSLGRHLTNALRTGLLCAYLPEQRIDWLL
jgi:tetratricopeptide (TPR) repeat protein